MNILKSFKNLKILFFVMVAMLLMSGSVTAESKMGFSDLKGYTWAANYIYHVYENGGLKGYEDGSFRPGNKITRAEFVAVVVRIVKADKDAEIKPDEKVLAELNEKAPNFWANEVIAKAAGLNILNNLGYAYDKNTWNEPINRGDMAKISIMALENIKKEEFKINSDIKNLIPDIKQIEQLKDNELILKSYSNGIIMGYEDGSFKSTNYANRAEASTILARLINSDYRKEALNKAKNSKIPKLYDYDLSEYVSFESHYKSAPFIYNDEQLEEFFKQKIQSFTTYSEVERAVKEGDKVNIDFVGKKDGKAFEGGTANGHELIIGSNSFIDGFEKGLIGAKKGETRTLNLTFPKNYHSSELAGQAVTFDVTLNKVLEEKPAVFNDDFVKANIPGYTSAEQYKKDFKADAKAGMWFSKITAVTTVKKYPKKEYDEIVNAYFGSKGIPADSKEKYDKKIKQQIKSEMILLAVARSEGIEIDEKTFAEKYPKYKDRYEKKMKGTLGIISAERYAVFELLYRAVVKSVLDVDIDF